MNKSQRQISRRFDRYLAGENLQSNATSSSPVLTPRNFTVETVLPECTQERFALYKKYQIRIHHDDEASLNEARFTSFLVTSPLVRRVVQDSATGSNITFGTSHQLYRIDNQLVAVGVIGASLKYE